MTGVSQRAYARLRGVTLRAVQKAIATKRITLSADGTIDPATANVEWERNTFAGRTLHQVGGQQPQAAPPVPRAAPQRGGSGMPSQPEVSNDPVAAYLRARAVNETFKAKTAQLEYEERAGKLIQATKAGEYASQWSAIVGDALSAYAGSRGAARGGRGEDGSGDPQDSRGRDERLAAQDGEGSLGRRVLMEHTILHVRGRLAGMLPPRDISVSRVGRRERGPDRLRLGGTRPVAHAALISASRWMLSAPTTRASRWC